MSDAILDQYNAAKAEAELISLNMEATRKRIAQATKERTDAMKIMDERAKEIFLLIQTQKGLDKQYSALGKRAKKLFEQLKA